MTKRGWICTGGALVAATLVLVEQACSITTDHPARTPIHPAAAPASVEHAAAAPAATATAPSQSYDLQSAVPLLALTSLRPVMEALDEGQAQQALRLAQQAFVQAKPEGKQAKRWNYLLARLEEGAGDFNAARERYRALGAEPWPLSNYAQFATAQIELRIGNARAALDQAQHIVAPPPLSGLVDRLAADAASQVGAADIALVRYGACLNATPLPDGWQQIALNYARLLIEREEKNKGKEGASAADGSLGGALYWLKKLSREASADLNTLGDLSQRATQLLPESERLSALQLSTEERLAQIEALLAQRRLQEAENAAQDLYAAQAPTPFSPAACEARFLRAKALAGLSQWGKAVELLGDALKHCTDDNLKARAGFLAGKCAFSDKRYAATIALMSGVEANAAKGTLGDDARLYTALAYKELQDDAHFADALTRMLDDYPDGDMTREGAFRLALAKLSNRDYRAAIALLTRAGGLPDVDPDSEQAGRENYFLARAQLEAGDKEAGLTGLGALIESRPMSYYMLHAFSRLAAIDATRAREAMEKGIHRATEAPFTFEHRDVRSNSAWDDPALERGLELLQVGDLDSANAELRSVGVDSATSAPELLWGIAILYQQMGAAHFSQQIAGSLERQWLTQWPSGPWLKAWQLAYPRPYEKNVSQSAKQYGVSPALLYAVMREESAFDPRAVSKANAYGLMQLLASTARGYSKKVGLPAQAQALLIPRINIAYGSYVLSQFASKFPSNNLLAIPGYNAGPASAKRWLKELPSADFDLWIELIPYRETRDYTKRVLASRAAYAYLYEQAGEEALKLPIQVEN